MRRPIYKILFEPQECQGLKDKKGCKSVVIRVSGVALTSLLGKTARRYTE